MPEFSNTVISLFHMKREAPDQGGLLSGKDPSAFNTTDPIRLWIIQVGVIVTTATLLSLGLRKMRQPMVIAEVLGGILLGPTAFGRIPGFTDHVFPLPSRPYLSLVANIGLCLFLFLVGLEIDAGVIKRNARLSATVALAGMILPFGLGAGLAVPLYNQFIDPSIKFTHFMLFTGVAFSITAFPVLCRILTELKLLDTTVGIVVLSAGVGNDIVGWTLLALSVALVNAGSGLTALYILLACVGWTLFLLFPIKYVMLWLARKTGSIESGPTVLYMTLTILLVFCSAFFTDVIGVHAIFGAFVAGIIIPRQGGLAISLAEKLEDMVSIIFLPLYFTLSGLSTNLGLLNDGITWAYTFAIISLAFTGKFGGCTLAAKYGAGFNWREAGTIGSLMSCKGLVELIVLNVGLSAGILSERVFSMFVLEALVLTFMTTPLVTLLYPPHRRVRVAATGANFLNVADDEARAGKDSKDLTLTKSRFTVILDKLEHLPGMMALTQLIQPELDDGTASPMVTINALRLIELSDRASAVMKSTSAASDAFLRADPLLAIFKMFGQLNGWLGPTTTSVANVPFEDLAFCVTDHAKNNGSDMIMIPWIPPSASLDEITRMGDAPLTPALKQHASNNPFDALFKTGNVGDKSASLLHSQFVRGVFAQATTDVALYVDPSGSPHAMSMSGGGQYQHQHIFLPFFGGPDDRLALEFVVQICKANEKVRATVVRVVKEDVAEGLSRVPTAHAYDKDKVGFGVMEERVEDANLLTVASGVTGFPDTVYGHQNTEVRMQSETADNVLWARYTNPVVPGPNAGAGSSSDTKSDSSRDSLAAEADTAALSRIEFLELATPVPLHAVLQKARVLQQSPCLPPTPVKGGLVSHEQEQQQQAVKRVRLTVVLGRSRRLAVENHKKELGELISEYRGVGHASHSGGKGGGLEVGKTVGDVAAAFVVGGCGSGVVVVQAALLKEDD